MVQLLTGNLLRACLVTGLFCLAPACGSADEPGRRAARSDAAAALEQGDASAALQLARRGLKTMGDDSELLLLAGTAALELKRFSEAIDFAVRGLPLAPGLELTANLRWVQGTALMGRFNDLHDDDDWRRANVALEPSVSAGDHRAEAALMLVLLQDMSELGKPERQLRYARKLLASSPGSTEAVKVTAYLKKRGIDL